MTTAQIQYFEEMWTKEKKWDLRFLGLCKHISNWSLDPSTKVGAVIVDKDNRVISIGYNGFAKGVQDLPERYNDRPTKLSMVSHAENNAILFAKRDLSGCVLYTWPFCSCSRCAVSVIQAGIKCCVAPEIPEEIKARWEEDVKISRLMFKEAGVVVKLYQPNEVV